MIRSKLPNVGTTIFTTMSQLAVQTGALNLSQGFPDFNGPQALLDAVGRHVAAGHNQYSPMTGLPALRQQVAAKVARLYGAQVDADQEVTITLVPPRRSSVPSRRWSMPVTRSLSSTRATTATNLRWNWPVVAACMCN